MWQNCTKAVRDLQLTFRDALDPLLHAWAGTGTPRQVFERPVTARQAKIVSRRILVSTGRQRQERLVCSDSSIVSTSNIMRSCFRP
jgi:hypothetical protein